MLFLLRQIYGDDEAALRVKLDKLRSQSARFLQLYGNGPVTVLRAPARINILGEHVDYVSYLPTASLPFGSRGHDMIMLCRASETDAVRGASTLEEFSPFSFELKEAPPASDVDDTDDAWLSYLYGIRPPAPHWGLYVKGALYLARLKYGRRAQFGFDFLVDSGIPPSGGASSSSALAVLAGAAIRHVNGIEYDPAELAIDSARGEWYVGTRGGAMDHITICMAKLRHAVRINYAEQQASLVPLPGDDFRWLTFFSHPADKGQEVMLEYNERAATSRIIIPAVINQWQDDRPELYNEWREALKVLSADPKANLEALHGLLAELPITLTINEVRSAYPHAYRECELAFPALVRERVDYPLQIRNRALHHLGEIGRVAIAERVLDEAALSGATGKPAHASPAMRAIGNLLNESHASLRDLYEVSTPEVDRLIEIILSDPQIYGTRLMGGGFGGNVLALTTKEHASSLIKRVQTEFYAPQNRDGVREGAVMVSTPGEGLSEIEVESVWRDAARDFNALGWDANRYRAGFCSMLDHMPENVSVVEVWPVIVAAGRGTRARATGLDVPKPLAKIAGVPAIKHVLRIIQEAGVKTRPAIIIVSPETETGVRDALAGEDVTYVLQPEALGTGDAVLCAREQMLDFSGRALVVWSTQPVIRPATVARTLKLATLFADYELLLPTANVARPYAPLLRDHRGRVRASRETHLEQARAVRFGETNIGLFVLRSEAMFDALLGLRRAYWNETDKVYQRHGGELGFPNEMINRLSEQEAGVLASPIADARESQGIKGLDDVELCERFISELERERV